MKAASWLVVGIVCLLGGCDAWPTRVFNDSQVSITFQYRDSRESMDSAPFPLAHHETTLLARDVFMKNIKEIDITEGPASYRWTYDDLASFRRQCPDVCGLYYSSGGHLRTGPYGEMGPDSGYQTYNSQ